MSGLDEYLQARREEIERGLTRFLAHPPHIPVVVAEAMRYSLSAGGKRLRPVLTLATADAFATKNRADLVDARARALPAACAIEMIHTYSLIHDDLPAMDDDILRRGRPTLHVIAGDGMAILAGDGLQAAAFSLLAREPLGGDTPVDARKLRTIAVIADAAGPAGMVGGQAIDLNAVRPAPGHDATRLDAAAVEDMHARKTGALIRASVVAGAIMAGATDPEVTAIDRYAAEIGLAFQIVDDILDVEAGSAALGKTAGKDAAAGKPTYPALFGLDQSRALASACLGRAEEAVHDAGLDDSHLAAIARWIVNRRS
ncbi:MAG TPA: farnesyl diphosphate synthase [Vicinamibacterales bacterium]|nr:farnesyl diphosphate synthase [Vicinamibacterales bacterium]